MTADDQFTIAKRFDTLHMRNVLYLQDTMAEIEDRLMQLDKEETCQTFLSSRRYDDNSERQELLRNLNAQLEAYGSLSHLGSRTTPQYVRKYVDVLPIR
jgi:hypothetical protein